MEEPEDNMVQVRKSHKVEQMVSKWLHLTRDSSHRNRAAADEVSANTNQLDVPITVTVKINKDPLLDYGFLLSKDTPTCVKSISAGGPGEGKLFPGDQVIKINNIPLDSISQEHIDNIIRECGNSIAVTVLRNTSGPKSSFITEEKRARLKSNPVKVRFAEEVIVNGHTQGNSLLFMPNVLKVYLENGQTKAFRYEKNTTVKDIILTLKSKLSIRCIEYFALVLKEQFSATKVYLLHEDEIIEQVVQKREARDYKCIFRVCFLPRDPLVVLQADPVTFNYLYVQSCNDVLQEKFAMEMKCNTAIRLAALQIQECILSSKQSQKISMKYIERDWGIENFVSPTLLHNMKEKDVRKAINYHLKNNYSLISPGQTQLISTAQTQLNYLNILSNLRTYGGKTFNATLMLQDRESFVTLLVGAKYGISHIINSKLNIMDQLTNFNNIRKLELTFECDKVSMVNIYLHNMKSLTLLLESHHAKDLVCFIAGSHRLYVNSGDSIFTWPGNYQSQLLTTEEGDETRGLSDSESSSDIDTSVDTSVHRLRNGFTQSLNEEDEDAKNSESEATDSDYMREDVLEETSCSIGSDLNDETSQGGDTCETSCSADSLEELQMETSTSSISGLHSYDDLSEEDDKDSATAESESEPVMKKHCTLQSKTSFPQLSIESLTSTQTSECDKTDMKELVTCYSTDLSPSKDHSTAESWDQCAEDVDGSTIQGNIFWNLTYHNMATELPPIPSPVDDGDASDLKSACMKGIEEKWNMQTPPSYYESTNGIESAESIKDTNEVAEHVMNTKKGHFDPKDIYDAKPELSQLYSNKVEDLLCCHDRDDLVSRKQQLPFPSSVAGMETKASLLKHKPLKPCSVSINKKAAPSLMEMEPDSMEIKSVTEAITVITTVSATRYPCDTGSKIGYTSKTDGSEMVESISEPFTDVKPPKTACSNIEQSQSSSEVIVELGDLSVHNSIKDKAHFVTTAACTDEQRTLNTVNMISKDQGVVIVKGSVVLEQVDYTYGPQSDLDQNGTALRLASYETDLKQNTGTYKEESDNYDKGESCYQKSNCSITSQKHLVMFNRYQEDFPEMSVLDEGVSDKRVSSMGDINVHSLDMNRLVLNLNCMSFKTFGTVKHLSSPTLEPNMEIFSVRPPNSSSFHGEHEKKNQSKSEWNCWKQLESIIHPTQTNIDNPNATLVSPGDENASYKGISQIHKSKLLYEVAYSPIQKTPALVSECPPAKSNSHKEPEEELGLSCGELVMPTMDTMNKELSTSGMEACSCQVVYGNCFRALGIDANNENKEVESLKQRPSPRTTPPDSGNPLPQIFTTSIKQGEESTAADHYFGVPEGDTAVKNASLALLLLKDKIYNMPNGFRLVHNDIVELLDILKECPRERHAEEVCIALPSFTKQKLYSECRKLMSACQKCVKVNQTPDEMILGVSESFRALSQLTGTCFQLTSCLHCAKAHAEVNSNLRKVVMIYKIFAQASEDACGKMSDDLSMKCLAEQCAAISARVFSLNHLFTTNSLLK
ncbi:FERM and PDZ domain-containing protein 1 [Amblyraja radiata]|uniref:FERM and PDZ domain-containing protein 1 n=1 Tax=Amblyraja radiata TaxID=386614 RepID=UPI001402D574|nr:FERM and PDZ domain-containing protein 1 [Amblyraja radiata]